MPKKKSTDVCYVVKMGPPDARNALVYEKEDSSRGNCGILHIRKRRNRNYSVRLSSIPLSLTSNDPVLEPFSHHPRISQFHCHFFPEAPLPPPSGHGDLCVEDVSHQSDGQQSDEQEPNADPWTSSAASASETPHQIHTTLGRVQGHAQTVLLLIPPSKNDHGRPHLG